MADIINRLLLDTSNFDAKLSKSKKGVNDYQGGITNMAKTAGLGMLKFAGAFGVAMGASEAFTKTINSSQTTGDAWNAMIGSAKASVDEFFTSLATGDFTSFLGGLDGIIDKARETIAALDQLGNTRMSYQVFSAKDAADLEASRAKAQDKGGSMYSRQKGFDSWNEVLLRQENDSNVMKETVIDALKKSIVQNTKLSSETISIDDFESILKYDLSDSQTRDALKERSSKSYDTYRLKYADWESRKKSGGIADWAFPGSDGAKERAEFNSKMSQEQEKLNAEYKESILFNQILVKWDDEKLQDAVKLYTEYRNIEKVIPTQRRTYNMAYNRFRKEKGEDTEEMDDAPTPVNGKSNKLAPAPPGSIAAIDAELSKLNKELIEATTMQARIAVQTTINELEAKKINLKVAVDKGMFAAKYGANKLSNVSLSEMAGTINSGSKNTKGSKGINLKDVGKIKSPISKKDVDLLDNYQERLYGISSIMSSMSGVMNESAAGWMNWGASLLSAVAQAIPAIKQLIPALTAKAGAEAISGSASSGPLGWISAGAAVAAVFAAFASLPAFSTGGIFEGGATFGDMNLARVNAGEMILNGVQQANLFRLLNSGSNTPIQSGNVSFKIHGKDLVGVISNYNNQKSKVR